MMLLFSFALISPLLASDSVQANLPACCRRAGKHHCAMAGQETQQGASIDIVSQKCPCIPTATTAIHLGALAAPAGHAIFAGIISHPAIHAQTAAQYRISFDRSRQKRGPPSFLIL
jgi:hypothetical protein